jgi:glyoxylase-like metal-dependent hydrolase (beta-lactamase superfamily II)
MNVAKLAEGMLLYRFPAQPGIHYPLNLVALLHPEERRALLIDAAFEAQAKTVAEHLEGQGLVVTDVVLSHLHDDHFEGLRALPPVTLHASPRSQVAIEAHYSPEDCALIVPDDPLVEGSAFAFGRFQLRFVEAPGHSACSVLTVIDERFVHVGDLLMAAADGTPLLPYVAFRYVGLHIQTLERIREGYSDHTLLLGHGPPLEGRDRVQREIDQRLCYLRGVLRGEGRLSYEEVMRDCPGTFLHTEWHARAPEVRA